MEAMHSLLKRQLGRCFGDQFSIPEEWQDFIGAVNEVYWASDTDRGMHKRSLEPSSQELLQANTEQVQTEEQFWQLKTFNEGIIQNMVEGIIVEDTDGHFTFVNPAVATMLGYIPEEMLGLHWMDITPPDQHTIVEAVNEQRMRGESSHYELDLVRKDGKWISVLIKGSPRFEEERFVGTIAVFTNITERKQAEEALQQRVAQLALINDIGGKIAAVLELESLLDRAARLVQENFGFHHVALFTIDHLRDELVMRARSGFFADLFPLDHQLKLGQGMVGWVAVHGEKLLANDVRDEPQFINLYPDVIPTGSELSVPIRLGTEVIGVLDVQSSHFNAFDENDVMVIETLADQIAIAIENARLYAEAQRELTERLRVEEALGKSEEQYHTLVQTSPVAITVTNMAMDFIFCNQLAAEMFGVKSPDQLVNKKALEIVAPEERLRVQDDFTKAPTREIIKNREYTLLKADGTRFPAEVNASTLRNAEGVPVALVSTIEDISERKQAEALRSRLASIVEYTDDAIISKTLNGTIVSWNKGAEKVYGYSSDEIEGQRITILSPPERAPEALQILERIKDGEPVVRLETVQTQKDGEEIDVSLTISPIKDAAGKITGVSTIARDIAERKKMEAYMLRTERLAAMGHIASVLAHEVKNHLQAVRSNLEVVLEFPLDPVEREESLEICSQELDHLEVITNRILSLASPKKSIFNMISLTDLIGRVQTLIKKPLLHAGVKITTDIPENLSPGWGVPDQFVEVMLNLIINSIESMPEGGQIHINVQMVDEEVKLSLTNNGPSIPPDHLPHIFDPFFTTKPEGTGLGLSISHSIIQNHRGTITVENLPDEMGVEFTIKVPMAQFDDGEKSRS